MPPEPISPLVVVLLTLGALILIKLAVLFLLGGGSFKNLMPATRIFFKVYGDPAALAKVEAALNPPPPEPPKPVKLSPEPVRLLHLLQRDDVRLLDFLLEDISQATDDQIGAGVRDIHRKAQAVLKEHVTLEPVLRQQEGDTVEVPAGFDPSAIQVVGNVTGSPPFRGTLKHHGWRVKSYNLPAGPEGRDELVMMPAQVEIP